MVHKIMHCGQPTICPLRGAGSSPSRVQTGARKARQSRLQATGKPEAWEAFSIVPRLFLYCSSILPLVLAAFSSSMMCRGSLTPRPIPRKRGEAETCISMNTLISKRFHAILGALCLLCGIAQTTPAQVKPLPPPAYSSLHFADYDSEPRRADGHVDGDALLARLKESHVTTYYWLVWHARTDWDDLKLFLPKAAQANLQIWVYLVPPTESAPKYGDLYCEPFRLDYGRWAEEIARLSLQHTNLTAWVIDDFFANHGFFPPAVIRGLQQRAKHINPRLAFLPLMYFGEIRRAFVQDYRDVIDGVVVAYPHDRDEINQAWAILNDAAAVMQGELGFP